MSAFFDGQQTPPGTDGHHSTPGDYQNIPARQDFLPGDGHRHGTEPPAVEETCPAGEARQADHPETTPPAPDSSSQALDSSPPNPLGNTSVSITRTPKKDGKTQVLEVMTLAELAEYIRSDQGLRKETEKLRAKLGKDGQKTPAFDAAKKRQKAAVLALSAPVGTLIAEVSAEFHNSHFGFDIDENDPDLDQLREDLSALPGVVMVGTSVSGTGLWCMVHGPKADSPDDYKAKHAAILAQMPESVQKANGEASKNLSRLRYLANDPDLFYNPHAVAFTVAPASAPQDLADEKPKAAGKRAKARKNDPERDKKHLMPALEYLEQAQVGKDDSKAIGVGYCLKAMGHDFQKWDEWAAKAGCTCPHRQDRWDSFNAADTDYGAIIGMAVNAGWKKPGKGRPKSERRLSIEEMAARGWQITGGKSPVLIHSSVVNAKLGLEETGWAERIRLNGWTGTLELDGNPKDISGFEDLARYQLEADHTHAGFRPGPIHVRTAIKVIAEDRVYNPTLSAIDQESWDGVDRYPLLARLLVGHGTYAPDQELDNAIAALIVRGMVVRALEPGAMVGYAPVLRSKREGPGKGLVIGVLAPGGHSVGGEFTGYGWQKNLRDKLRNVSALEIAEHAPLQSTATANMKAFITSLVMNERSSYAAIAIPESVRAMLFITTNRRHFLSGVEHRRFPVLAIPNGHSIDLSAVRAISHQLWAQAAYEYRQGDFLNTLGMVEVALPQNLWGAANERSKEYEAVSTTRDILESIIGDRTELDAGEFQRDLSGNLGRRIPNDQFGESMEALGWAQKRVGKARKAVWFLEE